LEAKIFALERLTKEPHFESYLAVDTPYPTTSTVRGKNKAT
jgi:hypothetical protein